jgi:hypothetical protein
MHSVFKVWSFQILLMMSWVLGEGENTVIVRFWHWVARSERKLRQHRRSDLAPKGSVQQPTIELPFHHIPLDEVKPRFHPSIYPWEYPSILTDCFFITLTNSTFTTICHIFIFFCFQIGHHSIITHFLHSEGLKSAPSLVTRSTLERERSSSALTTGEHHLCNALQNGASRMVKTVYWYFCFAEYVHFYFFVLEGRGISCMRVRQPLQQRHIQHLFCYKRHVCNLTDIDSIQQGSDIVCFVFAALDSIRSIQ